MGLCNFQSQIEFSCDVIQGFHTFYHIVSCTMSVSWCFTYHFKERNAGNTHEGHIPTPGHTLRSELHSSKVTVINQMDGSMTFLNKSTDRSSVLCERRKVNLKHLSGKKKRPFNIIEFNEERLDNYTTGWFFVVFPMFQFFGHVRRACLCVS